MLSTGHCSYQSREPSKRNENEEQSCETLPASLLRHVPFEDRNALPLATHYGASVIAEELFFLEKRERKNPTRLWQSSHVHCVDENYFGKEASRKFVSGVSRVRFVKQKKIDRRILMSEWKGDQFSTLFRQMADDKRLSSLTG